MKKHNKPKKHEPSENKTLLLAGNPNVGKSTVFNALTGLKQHTGNWTGKTVELARGGFIFNDCGYTVYDLPGTYSLNFNSAEEKVASDFILKNNCDLTIVVVDATCLGRNLILALQILEMGGDVLICLNLMDEAKRRGIEIDASKLEKELGAPVVAIAAKNKRDILKLKEKIRSTQSKRSGSAPRNIYPGFINNALDDIAEALESDLGENNTSDISDSAKRYAALSALTDPGSVSERLSEITGLNGVRFNYTRRALKKIESELEFMGMDPKDLRETISASRTAAAKRIADGCVNFIDGKMSERNLKIDKRLTSGRVGFLTMLLFFGALIWLTVCGANYPSALLSGFFEWVKFYLEKTLDLLKLPESAVRLIIDGAYTTVTWIIAVMLPPMAIFFPLFTLLEDLGYLPRVAFNLDSCFKRCGTGGKQALTLCMGLGCNAVGVVGCRIMPTENERKIAALTNSFIPCNGKFALIITVSGVIFAAAKPGVSAFGRAALILGAITLSVGAALLATRILSKTVYKTDNSRSVLELPPYRKPQIWKTIYRSVFDRTLFVLGRALVSALPAGVLIWLLANVQIGDASILNWAGRLLDPIGSILGIDGFIMLAFILSLPANEIMLPILIMCYMQTSGMQDISGAANLAEIFSAHGWTILTAVNVLILTLFHSPCCTTLLTIIRETGSKLMALYAALLLTAFGVGMCLLTTGIYKAVELILTVC